ncbi:MAG: hypothetical protein KatS3mg122_3239 [Caldimonas sp.]|nr:MAG: hypothetical protein KatS3mg122_3239 [Caldimonas sp.]
MPRMKDTGATGLAAPASEGGLQALRREAMRCLLLGAALVLAAGVGASAAWPALWGPAYAAKALSVFALAAVLVLRGLSSHRRPDGQLHARFGVANRVSLLRLAMLAMLAALLGEDAAHAAHPGGIALGWAVVVWATVGAVLDAVDGPLARRHGDVSEFGARLDMETDAALILVLCLLIVQFGQAGPWVLAAGAMRYAFVAAGRLWPWLARPLPPSLRRKTVCVVQIVTLIIALGPSIPSGAAALIAGAGLLLLTYSFAVDVRWLIQRRHLPLENAS